MPKRTLPGDIPKIVDDLFAGNYQNPVHQNFKEHAEAAGYEVEDYQGRFGYFGPCVKVKDNEEFQRFLREINTDIRLQWDSLGKSGKVVYPR